MSCAWDMVVATRSSSSSRNSRKCCRLCYCALRFYICICKCILLWIFFSSLFRRDLSVYRPHWDEIAIGVAPLYDFGQWFLWSLQNINFMAIDKKVAVEQCNGISKWSSKLMIEWEKIKINSDCAMLFFLAQIVSVSLVWPEKPRMLSMLA